MPNANGHISNYQELVDGILSELARGDVSVDAMRWIAATELELFRDCDVRVGDQKITGTLAPGDEKIELPAGTLNIRHIQIDTDTPVQLRISSLSQIMEVRASDKSGIPKRYYLFADTLELGPANSGTGSTPYTLWYYGLPLPLSESNPTNELFRLGWDAYLYGALMHSAPYLGDDERVTTWGELYILKKESLRVTYWRSRMSGTLEQQPDVHLSDSHTVNR